MPSRKRNKGKARKAKAAEGAASAANDAAGKRLTANDGDGRAAVTSRPQRFHTDAFSCRHGFQPSFSSGDPIYEFTIAFEDVLMEMPSSDVCAYALAFDQLRMKGLNGLWDDKAKRGKIASYLVHVGTTYLLEGRCSAAVAVAIPIKLDEMGEDFSISVDMTPSSSQTKAALLSEMRDMADDEREIIKFFHKRSGCNCLKERYKELKAAERVGSCCGCGVRKPRRQLFVCSSCHGAQYCSVQCQRKDWQEHKRVMCQSLSRARAEKENPV